MKNTSWVWKEIRREKSAKIVLLAISFSFLVTILMFIVSGTFIKNVQKQTEDIYGYFDHILYHAEQNTDNLSFSQKKISKKYQPYVKRIGTITLFDYEENQKNIIFGYADQNAKTLGNIHLLKGSFPKKEKDIVVCNSLAYAKHWNNKVGKSIEILGQKYYLSGIINDYSVAWNHPKDEAEIFPTILVSKSNTSLQNKELVNTRHLLIENEKKFQEKIYQKHKNLISNENKKTQDTSGRYEIPTFLIVLMIGCEVLLDLYVFSYYLEAMREKLSILRCLGMTKMDCFVYIGKKVIVLFALGEILGSLIGTAGAKFILWIFSKVTGTVLVLSIISKYYIFSFGFVAIAVIVAWVFMIRKIRYLSPMELFRKSYQKIKFRSKPKKVKKMTIIQLSIRYFKVRIRKLVMIVLMIAVTITLFLSVNLYVTQYQAQFGAVDGKMSEDYDYEFLTNQELTDTAYTDKKGNKIKIYAVTHEHYIFNILDYTKIVSDKLINNMRKNKDIKSVKSYLEVNDLYLLNAPEESENPYVSTYMNDRILDDCIVKQFSISNNTRGIQFFGFSKSELEKMKQSLSDGAIHMDKILSGEEVLLMVPSYEVEEDGDGGMMQTFLSKGQYQGKKNQYKDQKYSVGDTLDFVQITSKDSRLKGYINEQQAKSNLKCTKYQVKIGGIIRQRINWFTNSVQPPTAYTIIGLNQTIHNMKILPTSSRIQIFLKKSTSYEQFDPQIQEYQKHLTGFDYDNHAAKMKEYRQFLMFIQALGMTLITLTAVVTMVIILIEERVYMMEKQESYQLLHILGMPYGKIGGVIFLQSVYSGMIGILLSIPLSYAVIQAVFGGITGIKEYFHLEWAIESYAVLLLLYVISAMLSVKKLE